MEPYTLTPDEYATAQSALKTIEQAQGNLNFFLSHLAKVNKLAGSITLSQDATQLVPAAPQGA